MATLKRPQPVGTFTLPAGLLLIPDTGDSIEVTAVREHMLAGRSPADWPNELAGHAHAHAGRLDDAWEAFSGNNVIDRYNRYVLRPEGVDAATLQAELPPDLAPLVDVIRYSIGQLERPPEAAGLSAEIAAMVLSSQASAALISGDIAAAVDMLRTASTVAAPASSCLAALLLGNAGTLEHEYHLDLERAASDLGEALGGLTDTDLTTARAELHYRLGMVLHELAVDGDRPMSQAVHHYYSALQLVTAETTPMLWAAVQLNLGTAYLTMPMVEASDQLRAGIAVGNLRASLTVFTREDHPEQWASAQLNLANALVYMPSTHQGDNLVEAVERYEEILELRDRDVDPVGRARVLANQGNALAHLGIFDQAKAKLFEARYLFEEQLDHASVMTVRSVLDEISRETVPSHSEDELASSPSD